ncbi:transposase [Streptomyces flavochromogenes]|uniref:transposase n=1 Tax=Streptomyces flavochromogenes TaxID=68199 RepID=UPI003CC91A69
MQWARIEPLLPDRTPRRGGRWRDHRQVIDAIVFKYRTGIPWTDLPEHFGSWKGVRRGLLGRAGWRCGSLGRTAGRCRTCSRPAGSGAGSPSPTALRRSASARIGERRSSPDPGRG